MKPLKIGIWTLLFLSLPTAYNFAVTLWGLDAPIPKPIYIQNTHNNSPRNGEPYYLGDCIAIGIPAKHKRRFAFNSISIDQLAAKVWEIPCENPKNLHSTFIILMGAFDIQEEKQSEQSVNEDLALLERVLKRRFPQCKIITIPPYRILSIAKRPKHSTDGWHLTKIGYRALKREIDKELQE
jgi:hypothetical protein